MTAEQRLAYLLEVVSTPSNRGRLTHAWIAENVSLAVADGVYAAINAVSVPTAMRYTTGNGIDTTAALWKLQATAVAQSNESLSPHLDLLRDFESVRKPRWEIEGYATAPTLEQIQLSIDKDRLRTDAVTRYNAFIEALDSWDGSGEEPAL